ncbi:MAG TPA: phage terminase large subunit [Tepidisphaeraceae bacterium]|nr:phage terminase large subunit [Tepidisphaeraceae bacterium]
MERRKKIPGDDLLDPRYFDAVEARLCELDFYEFVRHAWKVIEPGTEFVPNWHINAICKHLEACTEGRIRRLIINVPPRSLKSRLVSVLWPAWVWTRRPETHWLFASYAHHLSLRDSLHCRDVIQSDWYQRHWGHRFRLREDQNQKTRFDNDRSGFRLASSPGGVGTGTGGDFIVADDPHNVVEVESDVQREAVLHWWDQSMSTRGNDPQTVCHVVVMQRLHENDLSGHLLEQGGYEHLCLPMEFEPERRCATSLGWKDPRQHEGQLLSPQRFPRKEVEALKRQLGMYGTAGQLQQRPAPLDGGLFKREWFEIVAAPPKGYVRRVRYWDPAASVDGDYTCGVLMSRTEDGTYFVEDVKRGKWMPTQRDQLIQQTAERDGHGVHILLEQEPGSAGKSVSDYLIRGLAGFVVSAERPTGAKAVRAEPLASQCGIRNVKLVRAGWNAAYIEELAMFPNARYDDQVDASSGAFGRLSRYGLGISIPSSLNIEPAGSHLLGYSFDPTGARKLHWRHRRKTG